MTMRHRTKTVLTLAAVALASLALVTPAGAAVVVDSNFVSGGPVTGTLLAIDTTKVADDDGNIANVGWTIVSATNGQDSGNVVSWEPDGSVAPADMRWMAAGSVATWTFDVPDGAVINSAYASFKGQSNTFGNHEYSHDEGTLTTVVTPHNNAAVGDLVLNWTDSGGATRNVNFEKLFSGPVTVAGGDGFELNLTAVTDFAWSDTLVIDYTANAVPEPTTFALACSACSAC